MSDYEIASYKVIWYAERGQIDGGGLGVWDRTIESIPFPSESEARSAIKVWAVEEYPGHNVFATKRVRRSEDSC